MRRAATEVNAAADAPEAPELNVSEWLNTDTPVTLAGLRGRVVVIEAFQMLCPGCIEHGIPLARTVARVFQRAPLTVLGLHTVFEHHAAMTPVSLRAFVHEFRVTFPVGVDRARGTGLPETMRTYGMRGTPSLILIDRAGRLRAHHFGQVSEMQVGAEIATLLAEPGGAG